MDGALRGTVTNLLPARFAAAGIFLSSKGFGRNCGKFVRSGRTV